MTMCMPQVVVGWCSCKFPFCFSAWIMACNFACCWFSLWVLSVNAMFKYIVFPVLCKVLHWISICYVATASANIQFVFDFV